MRIRNAGRSGRDKTGIMLTAMIDVVFLLLIFFIMTFRIVFPEGNFSVEDSRAASAVPSDRRCVELPVVVRLRSDEQGELAGIEIGESRLAGLEELHLQIRRIAEVGDAQIELDCDYNLNFEHVVGAITAISGYVDEGQIVKIIERVKLGPARKP